MSRQGWDGLHMARLELIAPSHHTAAIVTDLEHRTVAEATLASPARGRHGSAKNHPEGAALSMVEEDRPLGTLYLTEEPCMRCALVMVQRPGRPQRILYARPRQTVRGLRTGTDVLREAGIIVEHYTDRETTRLILRALAHAGNGAHV